MSSSSEISFAAKISKWGHSYCIVIPKHLVDKHNLRHDQYVFVKITPAR